MPVIACMVFDSGRDHDRTMMGATPEQAAEVLLVAGAEAIGANCGQGIAGFVPICRRLRATTDKPVWIKPNAGMPENVGGRAHYRLSPEEMTRYLAHYVKDLGVNIVGGCCGTTPKHIAALRQAVDRAPQALQVESPAMAAVESEERQPATDETSQMARKITEGRFVVAVEMDPPRGLATQKLIARVRSLFLLPPKRER